MRVIKSDTNETCKQDRVCRSGCQWTRRQISAGLRDLVLDLREAHSFVIQVACLGGLTDHRSRHRELLGRNGRRQRGRGLYGRRCGQGIGQDDTRRGRLGRLGEIQTRRREDNDAETKAFSHKIRVGEKPLECSTLRLLTVGSYKILAKIQPLSTIFEYFIGCTINAYGSQDCQRSIHKV